MSKERLVTTFVDQGQRDEMQDTILQLPSVRFFLPQHNISGIFGKIHNMFSLGPLREDFVRSGAVASLALVDNEKEAVTAVNLGDSRVTLLLHNMKTNDVRCVQLTEDQNIANPAEVTRIEGLEKTIQKGAKIEDGYLMYTVDGRERGIAVTGSVGDNGYSPYLRREPEFTMYDLKNSANGVTKDDEVIVLVESDGAHRGLTPEERIAEFSEFAKENKAKVSKGKRNHFNLQSLSEFIARKSYESMDKIKADFLTSLDPDLRKRIEAMLEPDYEEPEIDFANYTEPSEEEAKRQQEEIAALYAYSHMQVDNMAIASTRMQGNMGQIFGVIDAHGKNGKKAALLTKITFMRDMLIAPGVE